MHERCRIFRDIEGSGDIGCLFSVAPTTRDMPYVWVAWTAVCFANLQVTLLCPGNNGYRDISAISLTPGFNWISGKAVKRIIWIFCWLFPSNSLKTSFDTSFLKGSLYFQNNLSYSNKQKFKSQKTVFVSSFSLVELDVLSSLRFRLTVNEPNFFFNSVWSTLLKLLKPPKQNTLICALHYLSGYSCLVFSINTSVASKVVILAIYL
jgi:hypothetical protein